MDSEALKDVHSILPDWISRIEAIGARFPIADGEAPVELNPIPPHTIARRAAGAFQGRTKRTSIIEDATGTDDLKMADVVPALPGTDEPVKPKARFSSLSSPEVLYDGEAQQFLCECWTFLNGLRGGVRKEIAQVKRKKVWMVPSNYDFGNSEIGNDGIIVAEDGDTDEEEEERQRQEEERLRIAEEERVSKLKKRAEVLEFVDDCIDKTAQAAESAAYIWLKGDGCYGHVLYMTRRLKDAMNRIVLESERLRAQKSGVDEGVADDTDIRTEEHPHKRAMRAPLSISDNEFTLSSRQTRGTTRPQARLPIGAGG